MLRKEEDVVRMLLLREEVGGSTRFEGRLGCYCFAVGDLRKVPSIWLLWCGVVGRGERVAA